MPPSDGGGIVVWDSAEAKLSGTQVYSNSADSCGGGLLAYFFSTATLSGTNVVGNSAGDCGGGVYSVNNSSIIATNSCFVNNSDTSVHLADASLVATDNWWGSANGPSGAGSGGGDSVGQGIDFSSFKSAAPAGCPTLESDLVIQKTIVPTAALPGGAITYTLVFTNTGPHVARYVTLTDTMPISMTVDQVISSGVNITQSVVGNHYTWTVTDTGVIGGAGGSITVTGVLAKPLLGGWFTNTVWISSATADPESGNDSSDAEVEVYDLFSVYLPVILSQ
jgi:uncharacterized repeat protein (TIGR01451 family)